MAALRYEKNGKCSILFPLKNLKHAIWFRAYGNITNDEKKKNTKLSKRFE